jgi:hypothetical protein
VCFESSVISATSDRASPTHQHGSSVVDIHIIFYLYHSYGSVSRLPAQRGFGAETSSVARMGWHVHMVNDAEDARPRTAVSTRQRERPYRWATNGAHHKTEERRASVMREAGKTTAGGKEFRRQWREEWACGGVVGAIMGREWLRLGCPARRSVGAPQRSDRHRIGSGIFSHRPEEHSPTTHDAQRRAWRDGGARARMAGEGESGDGDGRPTAVLGKDGVEGQGRSRAGRRTAMASPSQ